MKSFKTYHEENPKIYLEFKKYTFEAKIKGFKHYSAKGIFELIRWHSTVGVNDGYKVNNNYHPDYARLLMSEFPEYKGFFNVRELKKIREKGL